MEKELSDIAADGVAAGNVKRGRVPVYPGLDRLQLLFVFFQQAQVIPDDVIQEIIEETA